MLLIGDAEAAPLASVEIKYSPIVEMMSSLHVLTDPAHHPAWESWAVNTLSAMDANLRAEFEFLSTKTMNWALMIDFVCYIEQHDIDSVDGFLSRLISW